MDYAAGTMEIPALRGKMAGSEYYVAMFSLAQVARFFEGTPPDLPAEFRAQRKLMTKRIPEITSYLINNDEDWVFSSLTVSYEGEDNFEMLNGNPNVGMLKFPLDTKFLINDGQHRHAGIVEALKQNRELGKQTISVVLFPVHDLDRSQQLFSDLNRTVRPTSKSLNIMYDHRDPMNELTMAMIPRIPIFKDRVDKEASSLPNRSRYLATLSALYEANKQLLEGVDPSADDAFAEATEIAVKYWNAVTEAISQWRDIRDGANRPAEVRTEYICTHAIALHALGRAGKRLLAKVPMEREWTDRLRKLDGIDWAKTNEEWQNVCMLGPDIVNRRGTRAALTELLCFHLGLRDTKPQGAL